MPGVVSRHALIVLLLAGVTVACGGPMVASVGTGTQTAALGLGLSEQHRDDRPAAERPAYRPPVPAQRWTSCEQQLLMGRIIGVAARNGEGEGALSGDARGAGLAGADGRCVGHILEHAPDGRAIDWIDGGDGRIHQMVPVRSYQAGDGYCRDFDIRAGRQPSQRKSACREPDGIWRLRDDATPDPGGPSP